ncbi:SPOSA6832_03670 [Sporobolomyces salmonicolor]|uniref:SPOSA6832_03670-mRNA-1:cds n=1 Tax=Sporidiobolus salmonicolor TaxID=5005 RepID=A0A0D6EPQ6_SPOSA|nr:SPOSA6832_03670 [Sporobolomyces salmonicolor]
MVYIAAAKRTAFGKAALSELPEGIKVDSVHFGLARLPVPLSTTSSLTSHIARETSQVLYSDPSAAYLARHVGHLSGLPVDVPALTVNRLCGSGFQTIINAVQEIKLGEAHVVLTGGSENMSLSPYTLSGESRFGSKYGIDLKLEDSLAAALTDRVPNPTTAENLANKFGITREQCDEYALQSQKRWKEALDAGAFAAEITPIALPSKRKGADPITFAQDEHPRPQATKESLAKLPSVFAKGGVVSAGNASGICDGAAANIVVSEEALKRYGIKPLARVLSYHVVAVEPTIMGIGPVEAIRGALEKASLKMEDIDLFDVNEAFAAQWLSVQRELGLPNEKTNVFGGAIALGHPLAASGARITANLVHNLHRLNKRYAVGSACIGGGQGIAIVLEKV